MKRSSLELISYVRAVSISIAEQNLICVVLTRVNVAMPMILCKTIRFVRL